MAGEPLFCTKASCKLYYERYKAGTFDCVVVRERKKEDAPLHHLDNYVENWYVPGMGYVRHDVYNENMELEQTEILQKVTPSSAR